MQLAGKRIWVAGHRGMVGSALVRRLADIPCQLIFADRNALDLTDQAAVRTWMRQHRPEIVVLAAARVGGILANIEYPADFLADNLLIAINVIDGARRNDVEKLLFLGSSAAYPRDAEQPIVESSLLAGPLDRAHEGYAVAKIAGVKLCQTYRDQHGCNFISAMPTNLYGPGDHFGSAANHVVPALMSKIHEAKTANAKSVTLWGTGTPRREFLFVDDCADACVHLLERYDGREPVNVGFGEDVSIRELAELVCRVVGFEGRIEFDTTKPDGVPRKLLSPTRMRVLGWHARVPLLEGLHATYDWFEAHDAR